MSFSESDDDLDKEVKASRETDPNLDINVFNDSSVQHTAMANRRSSRRIDARNHGKNNAVTEREQHAKSKNKRMRRRTDTGDDIISLRQKTSYTQHPEPNKGFIPDWCDPRIPHASWEDIFHYAAADASTRELDSSWLLSAAVCCKTFAEPAIAALYRRPIIKSTSKAKKLASLLNCRPSETIFNYQAKVEELHIDIHLVPQAALVQLIQPLYRLKELIIFTPLDQPPYRELNSPIRWKYSAEIFEALLAAPTDSWLHPLKPLPVSISSWEWSGRFIGGGGAVATLKDISRVHDMLPFHNLTRVSFTNFQLPSLYDKYNKRIPEEVELERYKKDCDVIETIAHSISQLQHLKHLVFESSTVVNHHMLPLLPKSLEQLDLINCWEVNSEDFNNFLQTHGSHLRILTLHHNQSLNLEFLTHLTENCPSLLELNMNLSYFKLHDSIDDSDPMYEQALLPQQVPMWPSSLRTIIVENVRKWDLETAEMFLTSLLNSAESLPNLRHLSIKTMLDIPWQRRATLRGDWRRTMEEVFLRQVQEPMSDKSWRRSTVSTDAAMEQTRKRKRPETNPSRRSQRIVFPDERSIVDKGSRQKSLRQATSDERRPQYREIDTDEEESDGTIAEDNYESAAEDNAASEEDDDPLNTQPSLPGSKKEQYIQGLCKSVNVLFDNQKARELQYGMEDFRSDDDNSDDEEDWDGNDELEADDPVIQF